jgi:hypothetical protein
MNTLILLLTIATSTLVLRSGERLAVEGPVTERNGVITFRMNGLLYSMPIAEVNLVASTEPPKPPEEKEPRRLKVSAEERDRRLRELERNHSGVAAPPSQLALPPLPPPPTPAQEAQQSREEWEWRRMARDHEEAVRRAREEKQLIEDRIEGLQNEIRSLVNLGFKQHQFTYQTARLVQAKELLPLMQLEIDRAQRANEQFREDARRQGVLPGWLR